MSYIVSVKSVVLLAFSLALLGCNDTSQTAEKGVSGGLGSTAFPSECANCHGDAPTYAVLGARLGYEHSGHALGFERSGHGNAMYANGSGCQTCHTHEGFVAKVNAVEPQPEFIANPSQPSCFTCHKPHESFDFSLRTTAPVTLANGTVFDKGGSNICAECHQSRTDASTISAMPAGKISAHFGPHHGPQADLFSATNAFEFAGKQYSSSAHKFAIDEGCTSCHMTLPEGRYGLSAEIGGHSFSIAGDVHGSEKLNLAGCVACHADMKQAKGEALIDYVAKDDYDQDGELELIQLEVQGLLDRLVNQQGSGLLQRSTPALFDAQGQFIQRAGSNELVAQQLVGALYNYKLFGEEDCSLGMHNPTYTLQVLTDTVEALDPAFDTRARPAR